MYHHILITISDEEGQTIFTADTTSVDRAIEELGRFERFQQTLAASDLGFPPQGEPGGDPEEPLTEKEADEQERSSHTHPTS
jgi:hypothetical protein